MIFKNKRYIFARIISACVVFLILCGGGIVLFAVLFHSHNSSPKLVQRIYRRNIYETKWQAEKWFDNPVIVELCHAIEKQDVEEMQRLIDSGADVNVKGKGNMPLLLWAYPAGEKGLECLLKNGADPNVVLESSYLGPYDVIQPGCTLLYTAVQSTIAGDPRFTNYVDLLLKYGAGPNLGNRLPLPAAASQTHSRRAFYSLVNAGADVNIKDDWRSYPILYCVHSMHTEQLLFLLKHGAIYDVNTPQGSALQRLLYQYVKSPESFKTYYTQEEHENIKTAIKWLEERGVTFDEPAPRVEK